MLKYTLLFTGLTSSYNLYGGNQDLQAVFGDIPRFLRLMPVSFTIFLLYSYQPVHFDRWRVSLMERGIQLLNFETTDQMLQVHDYDGVSLSSRDANSKKAANEATEIFTSYYPEFLVSSPLYLCPAIKNDSCIQSIRSGLSMSQPLCRGYSGSLNPSYHPRQLPRWVS